MENGPFEDVFPIENGVSSRFCDATQTRAIVKARPSVPRPLTPGNEEVLYIFFFPLFSFSFRFHFHF